MVNRIPLNDHGVRLFACRLFNHDYLWFSSYEISKQSTTLPVLHNYAITYSLGDLSYGVCGNLGPQYEADLARISLYATPALAEHWNRTRMTYNAVNDRTLRTDDAPRGVNSPDMGWRTYLDPVYSGDGRSARGLGFWCYVFTLDGRVPKGVTRLGKKGAAVRVQREELENATAVFSEHAIRPSHPLNPLDIAGQIRAFEPVSVPPHLLLRTAEVSEDWFVLAGGDHRVHVPKRVIEWCQR